MDSRREKILKLKKKLTYDEIGKRFHITASRVEQIINPLETVYCRKHKERFLPTGEIKTCLRCYIDKKYTNSFLNKNYLKEVIRLKKRNRNLKEVFERKRLVRYLKEVKKLSDFSIGKLLDRHHTTVSYLLKDVLK